MVVIYHRNRPLPKVWKGLDGYTVNGDEEEAVVGCHG
jgi:hypothetical protein